MLTHDARIFVGERWGDVEGGEEENDVCVCVVAFSLCGSRWGTLTR